MKTEYIEVSPTQKQLVVEIPTEVVDSAIARVTRDYGKSARIPGFRPGKAPSTLVLKRFRDQILHDVMHDLIPRVMDEALRERSVEPVDTPAIRDVQLDEGRPLRFTAAFETVPPIDGIDYDSIALRRSPIAVSEEAVDATLQRLRERNARFEPVADRPSAPGDVLTLDLVRRVVAQPGASDAAQARVGESETHDGVSIEIGAPLNPPGFDAELTGLEPGAAKTFTVTFPSDYAAADLQNAEVEYSIAVKAIKHKVLPAVDDEFAKDLGDFDSLTALRERVRADLAADAERRQEREVRDDLLRQLARHVTIELPESLVERELDRRLESFVGQLMEQHIEPNEAGIDWNEFRERQRDPARESVKSLLVLDDIARREAITPTEGEIDSELARLAERTGRSIDVVRARLAQDGGLGRLRAGLRREKTVEFLLSRATILTV